MSNYLKHKFRGKSGGEIAAMIIFGGIFIAGLAVLFGFVIMWLWNWLMPMVFDLPPITYWQGIGLFLLAKIFFGGCGGSSRHKKHSSDWECKDDKKKKKHSDFSKWKHYDKFWEEEGDKAYEAYLAKLDGDEEENTPPPPASQTDEKPE